MRNIILITLILVATALYGCETTQSLTSDALNKTTDSLIDSSVEAISHSLEK